MLHKRSIAFTALTVIATPFAATLILSSRTTPATAQVPATDPTVLIAPLGSLTPLPRPARKDTWERFVVLPDVPLVTLPGTWKSRERYEVVDQTPIVGGMSWRRRKVSQNDVHVPAVSIQEVIDAGTDTLGRTSPPNDCRLAVRWTKSTESIWWTTDYVDAALDESGREPICMEVGGLSASDLELGEVYPKRLSFSLILGTRGDPDDIIYVRDEQLRIHRDGVVEFGLIDAPADEGKRSLLCGVTAVGDVVFWILDS